MKDKNLILVAKMFTVLFAPHYFPLLCLLVLMGFSYMRSFPLNYKIFVLAVVYVFTVVAPMLLISLYHRMMKHTIKQRLRRELRMVPYCLSLFCYFACYHVMSFFVVPHFVVSVVIAAICVQLVCLLCNNWHKVSTHSAAAGAMNGALMAFSIIFNFNPTWWLCLTIIIAGAVGSSRLILRRHSLAEVQSGMVLGFVVGFGAILFL